MKFPEVTTPLETLDPRRRTEKIAVLPSSPDRPCSHSRSEGVFTSSGVPADPLSLCAVDADFWLQQLTLHISTCNLGGVSWWALPASVRVHAAKGLAERNEVAFFLTFLVAMQHGVKAAPPARVAWIAAAFNTHLLADRVALWSSEACAMNRRPVVSGEVH